MEFAYVTFSNSNSVYLNLLKIAIDSILTFSRYPILVYLIDTDPAIVRAYLGMEENSDRIKLIYITGIPFPHIFCYKPYIILHAIENGLVSGLYMDADSVCTPNCDKIKDIAEKLTNFPISPIHPSDCIPDMRLLRIVGATEKTQPYVHADHIAFRNSNIDFLKEWLTASCSITELYYDETALNCLLWKYKCKTHFYPLSDPYYTAFYEKKELRDTAFTFHGCKDREEQRMLFEDMKIYYTEKKSLTTKLNKELQSFQGLWPGGFFNNIEQGASGLGKLKDLLLSYIRPDTVVLEIGCGRGAWIKYMLNAKYIYCLDALSADHNNFWSFVGEENKKKIRYIQVEDFSCKEIRDDSIDFIFSYDTFCSISYSGAKEYMKAIFPKLKKGACGLIAVADYNKYITFGTPGTMPGKTIEEDIQDYDGDAYPGRWYWYGVDRFCDVLYSSGYSVVQKDTGTVPRDPVTYFVKPGEASPPKIKVISFCLWGNLKKYNVGAIENAKLAKKFYPDFSCWFYIHSPSVPKETIQALEQFNNVKIILREGEIKPNRFMSWRFEPHDDPEVELFISRDTDTRILLREALAVREWIRSGKTFHIMRDSPSHYPTILGGMFGSRKIDGICMLYEIEKYFSQHLDNDDQTFLKDSVYSFVAHDCVVHDEIKKYEGEACRKFPVKYDTAFHFVGEYVYEEENREQWCTDGLMSYVAGNLSNRIENSMGIKYCLLACDNNPLYYTFYPLVRQCWLKFTGIETKLVLVADNIPECLKIYTNEIVLFPPEPDIHPAFQAQCIRLLYPGLMDTPEGVITSDMDLIPLNREYYMKNALMHGNNSFIVYRDCISEHKQFPICFCLATPDIWKSIFGVDTWADIRKILREWYVKDYSVSDSSSVGWATDQLKLYEYLGNWPGQVIRLTDENTKFKRLDRSELAEIEKDPLVYSERIKSGYYTDFHLPRPLELYETILSKLIYFPTLTIGHVYIMHYTKLEQRRKYMQHQLEEQGILGKYPITWVTQFDRENLTPELVDQNYAYKAGILYRNLTPAEIGNGMAHNYIIQNTARLEVPSLIFEDDIVLKPNFLSNLEKVLIMVPLDWDIIAIGGNYDDPSGLYVNDTKNVCQQDIRATRPPRICTTVSCYILSPRVAEKISAHYLFRPFSLPIDDTLCRALPDITKNVYWVQPWLAYEGSKTDLFSTSLGRGF